MARKKDINAFVADTKFMDMFAEAYLACGNVATKALLLVRPDMAQKNQNFMWNLASACIKNPYFEVALEKAKKKKIDEFKVSKGKVAYMVSKIAQEAYDDGDRPNALKGCDMLAKMSGAYQPEVQINNFTIGAEKLAEIQDFLFGKTIEGEVINKNE